MKLTLGQAAKEVGLSKTAISNAIKKGRLSAEKKEGGTYAIDPAELFRVYPPKGSTKGQELTKVDRINRPVTEEGSRVLTQKIDGLNALLEEKEKQIQRLIGENEKTEELLDGQIEQSKRITLLLQDHRSNDTGSEQIQRSFRALEARLADQEKAAKEQAERQEKIARQNKILHRALNAERNKGFIERLFSRKKNG